MLAIAYLPLARNSVYALTELRSSPRGFDAPRGPGASIRRRDSVAGSGYAARVRHDAAREPAHDATKRPPVSEGLTAELWIAAHLRRCAAEAVPATVARRGDAHAGAVLLKLWLGGARCRVLAQTRDAVGRPAWLAAFAGETVAEPDADAYIERAVARDPDLWVVEIEHADGWHPFDGRVL